METEPPSAARIAAIREFNRFYTRQVGLLEEHLEDSPFTLSAARVLHEIAHREEAGASDLAQALGLNSGYLSRLLTDLETRGMIDRKASPEDRRRLKIELTGKGREAYATLNAASEARVGTLLSPLDPGARRRLVGSMGAIREILGESPETHEPWLLRSHRPGDLGWIVHRHGVLYHREYGWDERFEGLVAGIVSDFVREYDPALDRCWIAERDGKNVGSVLLVKHPDRPGVARLRLLLVEPDARGLGIGARLVNECTRFAREAGYRTLTLWTNSVLHGARRLYEREGYRRTRTESHESYGAELVSEDWDLEL